MKINNILRDYQIEPSDYIMNSQKCVLAACPNAGKTEITINVIGRYLKQNNNVRILILTHSTTVLLDNFIDRLNSINVSFKYSTELDTDVNVHVCLPHNEHKIQGHYDFLIVDEAHENYLANRVQRIIENIKPTKQLLLTGTPSKFIKEGGYDFYFLAANEISDKWFSKLNIELVASDYNWIGYYNSENEVEKSFQFVFNETKKTLESVMLKLIDRFTKGFTPKEFNNPTLITKLKSWAFTYKTIGKTLIVCKTIRQAEDVYKILIDNNVVVGISHSECDDGNEIRLFKKNKYDVLVVVNRARLGYSDADLINIIDISGTHNPDIIYQMMMRTIRGNPDIQKYYLKLTPKILFNMSLTHLSVTAALMLTDKNYLSTYNGTNFNNIKIPIIKHSCYKKSGINKNIKNNNVNRLPGFTYDVIDTFKNILHNLDNPVSIYKMTTFNNAKLILGHTSKMKHTRESIFTSAAGEIL